MPEELLKQQKMSAEFIASYRALEDFVHMVSHDLQSPLKKISSFATLARLSAGDTIPDKTKHYLDRIEASAHKAAELVAGLLEYSKKSASINPPAMIDMNDVLRDVLSELELRIEESGAKIDVSLLPKIVARRTQIYWLFVNLLENAINYRSTRPLEIKIAASKSGHEWIFSVKDNGIGIDAGEWENVF
jgi:light-regulated signal transduction histidine kinase (bacteriophytochrome)